MTSIKNELLAGSLAGMANIITIRTRLQASTSSQYRGPYHCAKLLVEQEGFLGLYKGFSAPFVAQAVYKSVIFTTNSLARSYIDLPESQKYLKIILCGFISGGVNSFIVTPVELIRNQLMIQQRQKSSNPTSGADKIFAGPVDILKTLHRSSASTGQFFLHLFRGLPVTFIRDGGGMGVYFLGFELSMKLLATNTAGVEGEAPQSLSRLQQLMISGAVAGACFWIFALPFDCIKTRIQASTFQQKRNLSSSSSSLIGDVHALLKSLRIRDLYRGWEVALGRGIPGAASTLTVYHFTKEKLDGYRL